MRSSIGLILFTLLCAIVAQAAEPGFTDYIMAIKPPADDAKFSQAKADVEAAGGKVIHEIKTGFKALIISLPNHQVWTFDNKDYIDFMEQDQEVHINK